MELKAEGRFEIVEGRNPVNPYKGLESDRKQGFDPYSAIGEIVDNSIEANADEIHVFIEWNDSRNGIARKFVFVDNGDGMEPTALWDCLVVGESTRANLAHSIGRFGVGATYAGISQAKRIEIYSKTKNGEFLHTFLDLDLLAKGVGIPKPKRTEPPKEFVKFIKKHGTIVIWDKVDRSMLDREQEEEVQYWLARTYRKYTGVEIIRNGKVTKNEKPVKILLNGKEVYSHDPLYATINRRFPEDKEDIKKTKLHEKTVKIKIPSDDNTGKLPETDEIIIRMSFLPQKWWEKKGSGGTKFVTDRKIDRNEGVSILRENREIHYGDIPYFKILHASNEDGSGFVEKDRFWGCEILFNKKADPLFGIQVNKSRVFLTPEIRKLIQTEISDAVNQFRRRFSEVRKEVQAKEEQESLIPTKHTVAEKILGEGEKRKPLSAPQKEKLKKFSETFYNDNDLANKLYTEVATKPFKILEDPHLDPAGPFISFEFEWDNIVIRYNMRHPFMAKLLKLMEESDSSNSNGDSKIARNVDKLRTFFDLMMGSYAHASRSFTDINAKIEVGETLNKLMANWSNLVNVNVRKLASYEKSLKD